MLILARRDAVELSVESFSLKAYLYGIFGIKCVGSAGNATSDGLLGYLGSSYYIVTFFILLFN
jgi:hypothetical protein